MNAARKLTSVTPWTQSVIDNTLGPPKSSKKLNLRPQTSAAAGPFQSHHSTTLHGAPSIDYSEWSKSYSEWRKGEFERKKYLFECYRIWLQIFNHFFKKMHPGLELVARLDQARFIPDNVRGHEHDQFGALMRPLLAPK